MRWISGKTAIVARVRQCHCRRRQSTSGLFARRCAPAKNGCAAPLAVRGRFHAIGYRKMRKQSIHNSSFRKKEIKIQTMVIKSMDGGAQREPALTYKSRPEVFLFMTHFEIHDSYVTHCAHDFLPNSAQGNAQHINKKSAIKIVPTEKRQYPAVMTLALYPVGTHGTYQNKIRFENTEKTALKREKYVEFHRSLHFVRHNNRHDNTIDGNSFAKNNRNQILGSNSWCLQINRKHQQNQKKTYIFIKKRTLMAAPTRDEPVIKIPQAAPITERPMEKAMPIAHHVYKKNEKYHQICKKKYCFCIKNVKIIPTGGRRSTFDPRTSRGRGSQSNRLRLRNRYSPLLLYFVKLLCYMCK